MSIIKVRNKNVLRELLNAGLSFEKISVVDNLKEDDLTRLIIEKAKSRKVPVEKTPFHQMDYGRSGQHREVLMGYLIPENDQTLKNLLMDLYQNNQNPFFLLLNRISYPSNIGVVVRTAFAAGVNGLLYQSSKEQLFNEEIFHSSMGTIARIPLVKMGIFEALHDLKKEGIKTYSLQTNGVTYFKEDLTGAVAFVLGEEGEGLSNTVSMRCDKKLAIPMQPGIDSLNVSSSASVILYEKVRQESLKLSLSTS
jgi:23S rRNA (guanosine2251-2'-O)-methyltransferase